MDNVVLTKPRGSSLFTVKETLLAPPATGYTDTVHLSDCSGFTIEDSEIIGGSEDCIDLNFECHHASIDRCKLQSGGKYCMTIKGGTYAITIQDVVISKHGTEVDIDLGNWSDQSDKLTHGITLINVRALDGQPVIVRILWATDVNAYGSNVKIVGALPLVGTGWLNRTIVWLWRTGRKYKLWGTKA